MNARGDWWMAAAAAAAALGAAALLVACRGGSSNDASPATITPRPSATGTATPTATATAIVVAGLLTDPRPIVADERRSLGPAPTMFPPWNGTSTMLYDIAAGTATDLGPGMAGTFSPDGKWMTWVANQPGSMAGDVRVIDVVSRAQQSIGTGYDPGFLGDGRLAFAGQNQWTAVDLATGARTHPENVRFYDDVNVYGESGVLRDLGDGYLLRWVGSPIDAHELVEASTRRVVLKFSAYAAIPAGPGTLAVATGPRITGSIPKTADAKTDFGTINIFLMDYDGNTQFIATSEWFDRGWPFAANNDYVVWTDRYCDDPPRASTTTKFLDRRTGKITQIDARLAIQGITPDGLFGASDNAWGIHTLIDPVSAAQRVELRGAIDPHWSPDYSLASIGVVVGGRGGACWEQ